MDDEDKIDNFLYSKNKIEAFKENLFNPKDLAEDLLFYVIFYALRQQKINKKDLCSGSDLQNDIDLKLY